MNFEGKVALVTGSSRGIGASIIRELASHGCDVVINYVNSKNQALELQKEVVSKYGIKAIVVKADVANEKEVHKMIDEAIKTFGKMDILVNNAGIALDNDFNDKTIDEFKKVLDVNLIGTYLVSKYAGQYMLKNSNGVIINITSTNGIDTNYPRGIDYDASKAGIISVTHNLALQYAPNIRVNAIAAGWVNTDAISDMSEEFVKEEIDKIYLKRFAYPVEIAKVVVFLASDDASYVNNAVIRVDGGY